MDSEEIMFSIKSPGAWFWSVGHSEATIRSRHGDGSLPGNWLVCRIGSAKQQIFTVDEFLADPASFGVVAREETSVAPADPAMSIANKGWNIFLLSMLFYFITILIGLHDPRSLSPVFGALIHTLNKVSETLMFASAILALAGLALRIWNKRD